MKVSICMPVYNNASELPMTLKSVFSQTCTDWELIAVDDGSTDGSLEILQSIKDTRVRVYSDGKNRGGAFRRNQATNIAQGEFIALMDADDLWHPKKIELQLDWFAGNPGGTVLCTWSWSMLDDEIVGVRRVSAKDLQPQSILRRNVIAQPSIMARAQILKSNSYVEVWTRSEDHELWIRLSKQYKIDVLPRPLLIINERHAHSLNNALRTFSVERHIYLLHAPLLCGWPTTVALILKSLVKSLVRCAVTPFNVSSFLVRRRVNSRSPDEHALAQQVLSEIQSAAVPGISRRIDPK